MSQSCLPLWFYNEKGTFNSLLVVSGPLAIEVYGVSPIPLDHVLCGDLLSDISPISD